MSQLPEPRNLSKKWWKDGVRFECQQSGKCCVSHGEYGFVYLTLKDRQNIAKELGLTTREFTTKHCTKTDGVFHIADQGGPTCQFLKNKMCTIYKVRPTQCRTWPFWPETMGAKAWQKDVVKFCPGVNKGSKIYSPKEIQSIIDEQTKWEEDLVK
ncbi:MAG: YkgJ family cysteine cluster protein [Bdellovibrionaceae bacterium]|nr:YkgJ family cysteine cluster protein [Pseudobdellovibrionaceae bacterium]